MISQNYMMPMPAPAQLDRLTTDLSSGQQTQLQQGNPVVIFSGDEFVGHVVANAVPDVVWDVLTDYDSFSDFLPTVVSSQMLSAEGDRHIVEQTDSRDVLFASVDSRVRTENVETPRQRIDFQLLEGDLKSMNGHWQIAPISDGQAGSPNQTLITQIVMAEAGTGPFEGVFHSVFTDSLEANLRAIQSEAERRQTASRD